MAGENQGSQQPGFAGAPRFGFAATLEGQKSLSSHVPQIGFAALQKAAERDLKDAGPRKPRATVTDRPSMPDESKPTPDTTLGPKKIKRPDTRELVDDEFSRLTSDGIVIGRRVVPTRGSGWKTIEQDLRRRSDAYSTVPHNKLTMAYLDETESDLLVDQVLQKARRRPRTPSDERKIVRHLREELSASMAALVRTDLENEALACDLEPQVARDLLRSIEYPDEYAFEKGISERTTDNVGIFSQASFMFKGLGSIGTQTKTVTLEDYTKVHDTGRSKIVDMLEDKFGLNTSHIREAWEGPQIPIWRMVGSNTLAGFQYSMPELPLDIKLGNAGVFER